MLIAVVSTQEFPCELLGRDCVGISGPVAQPMQVFLAQRLFQGVTTPLSHRLNSCLLCVCVNKLFFLLPSDVDLRP